MTSLRPIEDDPWKCSVISDAMTDLPVNTRVI